MSTRPAPALTGDGAPHFDLSPDRLRSIVEESLATIGPGARVLAIIPDKTRDDNTDLLFPFASQVLATRGADTFDALVAQGTHPPMTEDEKRSKIGAGNGEMPLLGRILDHNWDSPDALTTLGELSAGRVREITGGLLDRAILLRANRLLERGVYDTVLIFGSTMPHEVAGFSGGAKYFFPGVAGPELTHATHWLSALASVENTIGRIETPVRHLIEAAADHVPAQVISLNSVVTRGDDGRLRTHALFAGAFREGFRRACEVSRRVHIKYTGRKFKRVIALLDEHLDDMWVGGKASYRLGAIIEEGGELIIYAPHLRRISETHGRLIEQYGYAPLEKVRVLVDHSEDLQANLCVAAHLAHVAYAGRLQADGEIAPRFRITMATQIDEETCRRVNLGFMDYRTFKRADYEGAPDTLVVERAGRDLYLVGDSAAD
jgi:nickel-dependent lactate racemase